MQPNPVQDVLTFRPSIASNESIELFMYDSKGGLVFSKPYSRLTEETIDFSKFSSGLYTLVFFVNNSEKIVKGSLSYELGIFNPVLDCQFSYLWCTFTRHRI